MNVNHETMKVVKHRLEDHLKDLNGEEELLDAVTQVSLREEGSAKVDQMKMKNISMAFDLKSEKTKAGLEKTSRESQPD